MAKVKDEYDYNWSSASAAYEIEALMPKATAGLNNAVYGEGVSREEVSSLRLAKENPDDANMFLQQSILMRRSLNFRCKVLVTLSASGAEQARACKAYMRRKDDAEALQKVAQGSSG